jgi:hypothetical protein
MQTEMGKRVILSRTRRFFRKFYPTPIKNALQAKPRSLKERPAF